MSLPSHLVDISANSFRKVIIFCLHIALWLLSLASPLLPSTAPFSYNE